MFKFKFILMNEAGEESSGSAPEVDSVLEGLVDEELGDISDYMEDDAGEESNVSEPEGDVVEETEGESEGEGETDEVNEDEGKVGESEAEPTTLPEDEVTEEVEAEPDNTEQLAEQQRAFRQELEESFAISEDDAILVSTEPELILPKLAANVYERVMQDTVKVLQAQFQTQVPAIVKNMTVQEQRQTALKTQFYDLNPALKGQDENAVAELIPQYVPLIKQTNPDLTQEELIRKVGTVIGAALGVDAGKIKDNASANNGRPEPAAQPAPAPAKPSSIGGQAEDGVTSTGFLSELISETLEG